VAPFGGPILPDFRVNFVLCDLRKELVNEDRVWQLCPCTNVTLLLEGGQTFVFLQELLVQCMLMSSSTTLRNRPSHIQRCIYA
jgi:hypothetical protein